MGARPAPSPAKSNAPQPGATSDDSFRGTHSGYAISLNANAPGSGFMGSIDGFESAQLNVQLVAPETWCWVRASTRDEKDGTRVQVWVNGVEVANVLDERSDRPKQGAFGLEQAHDGSRVVFANLRWRPVR